MPTLDDVTDKFRRIIGGFEKRPARIFCLIGDGNGHAFATGRTDYVHLRLEDGAYYGVAFIDLNRVLSQYQEATTGLYDLPVVAGYSHEQPTLFQVLEVRRNAIGVGTLNPLGPLANVTGLAAVWQQDDVLISWALAATSRLHNFLVTIDGVEYRPTASSLLYTGLMNRSDHSDVFDGSLAISVVAVDVYGNTSPTPATLTATWTRQAMPDLAGGAAEWSQNDCVFSWSDPVRPYTFRNFLVTIGAVTFVTLTPLFTYTAAQNRADHGGVVSQTLIASVVAVDRDGYTSLIPLVINTANPIPIGDTVQDNFDTYGGETIAQSGSTGLRWLKIPMGGTLTIAPPSVPVYIEYLFSPPLDLTADGRFSASDYILGHITLSSPGFTYSVVFQSAGGTATRALVETTDYADVFLNFLRSTFVLSGAFDWTAVTGVRVSVVDRLGSFIDNPILLDVRLVRADPDDAATFNDTGHAWDFSGGIWHVYQDVPQVAYALSQIDGRTPGTRWTAIRVAPPYAAVNHFAAGVYLREAGAVGLLALAQDAANGYEVRLDTATDALTLLRWVGGVSTTLDSVTYRPVLNTRYTLGLVRDWGTNHLRVFISADDSPVFTDRNLRLFVDDATYLTGQVGVVSYGVNSRFYHVRAGSPEHALTAEIAFEADRLDGYHAADLLVRHEILMATGVTPPDPLISADGFDWLYSSR